MFKQIKKHEEVKSSFTRLDWTLKKPPEKSFHIEVPGNDGWVRVEEEEEITKALREEFTAHLRQATNTPFVQDGLDNFIRDMIQNENPSKWEESIRS